MDEILRAQILAEMGKNAEMIKYIDALSLVIPDDYHRKLVHYTEPGHPGPHVIFVPPNTDRNQVCVRLTQTIENYEVRIRPIGKNGLPVVNHGNEPYVPLQGQGRQLSQALIRYLGEHFG